MRIQLGNAIPALVKLDSGLHAKAKLQTVSVTGGVLRLARALGEGDFVEVAFQTDSGPVHGMAEMLNPAPSSSPDVLQPFRFIALGDDDHRTLRMVVDMIADRNFLFRAGTNSKRVSR